jgi:DNA-binding NarL/FixJ family response regulator
MEKKRIVIFDLDPRFGQLLESIVMLDRNFKMIHQYQSKENVLKNLASDQPDILIGDLDYSGVDGAKFLQDIKRKSLKTNFLVLTECLDQEFLLQLIGKGATGILRKESCIPKLLDALTAISNGGSPVDPYLSRLILTSMHENVDPILTRQENKILCMLSRGLTPTSIAVELSISTSTSRTHMKNIYKKLSVNTKIDALKKARLENLIPNRT